MKLNKTLGLATAGLAWLATSVFAQRVTTNPTAVPNTVSTPTFSPDTLRPSREQVLKDETAGQDDAARKNRRDQKRSIRQSRRDAENSRQNRNNTTSDSSSSGQSTNPQDAAYRQSSTSSGTTNNNSNTTNYNSNNVMTAPTGAGSSPSATGAVGDVRPGTTTQPGSVSAGSVTPSGTAVSTSGTTTQPNLNRPAATGTGEAVSGAANAPVTNPSAKTRSTTLADFVASQPDFSTLQNALQSTDLGEQLKGGQAYTVFAPSNAAFKKLPTQTQNVLLEGQNRDALKKLLTYHVVAGTVDGKELTRQINAGGGTAKLKTLNGGMLTAKVGADGRVMITDEQGNMARVDTPDQMQTNGVVHGIDKVLMPKAGAVSFK